MAASPYDHFQIIKESLRHLFTSDLLVNYVKTTNLVFL